MDLFRQRRPIGLDRAGSRGDLVTFGPEMMLDRADTPQAHVIGSLDDIGRPVNGGLVQVAVAADRAQRGAFGFILGGYDRVDDGHRFQVWHRYSTPYRLVGF